MSWLHLHSSKTTALRGVAFWRGAFCGLSVMVLGVLVHRFPLFPLDGPPENVVVLLWGSVGLLGMSAFVLDIAPPEEKALRGWPLMVLLGGAFSYGAFLFVATGGSRAAEGGVLVGDAYVAAAGLLCWPILWVLARLADTCRSYRGGT